jgi:hypothetical protein
MDWEYRDYTHFSTKRSIPQHLLLLVASTALAVTTPHVGHAQGFQVYCTANADGTTSCTGWQGGETLTCVSNVGGTSSCATSSGRSFVCIQEPGGVATCSKANGQAAIERPLGSGTDCTYTGQGNFTCAPPGRAPDTSDPVFIDQPPLINPSVDFDLIQPLAP